MEGPEDLRGLALRLGRPSLALSEQGDREVQLLGSAILLFCEETLDRLLANAVAGLWPLMYCYASDGWGRAVIELRQVKVDDYLIRRLGKLRAEFLLHRELVEAVNNDGLVELAMTFSPPRPMMHGKSG